LSFNKITKLDALFEASVLKALLSSQDLIFLKEKYLFDTDLADFWPCTMYINTKFAILDS